MLLQGYHTPVSTARDGLGAQNCNSWRLLPSLMATLCTVHYMYCWCANSFEEARSKQSCSTPEGCQIQVHCLHLGIWCLSLDPLDSSSCLFPVLIGHNDMPMCSGQSPGSLSANS